MLDNIKCSSCDAYKSIFFYRTSINMQSLGLESTRPAGTARNTRPAGTARKRLSTMEFETPDMPKRRKV